jgi:hypothetical protein
MSVSVQSASGAASTVHKHMAHKKKRLSSGRALGDLTSAAHNLPQFIDDESEKAKLRLQRQKSIEEEHNKKNAPITNGGAGTGIIGAKLAGYFFHEHLFH